MADAKARRESLCTLTPIVLVDISMWEVGRPADTSEGSTRDGPA